MSDGKRMRMAFGDGTYAHFEWPENIGLERLEMLEEVIELQLRSVRRAIERRKAESADSVSPVGSVDSEGAKNAQG